MMMIIIIIIYLNYKLKISNHSRAFNTFNILVLFTLEIVNPGSSKPRISGILGYL